MTISNTYFNLKNTWNVSFELFLIAFPFNIIEVKYRKRYICPHETAFDYFFLSFLFFYFSIEMNTYLLKKNISNLPHFCVTQTFKL